ncbi:MAG TPA: response regulator [Chthonomonadaceae bacterium]|nr:response regulator [Chthonomonadaceae bacterium]
MLPFIPYMTLGQPSDECHGCLKGKRIVLIENDAVTRWQLTKALKRAGLDIVAATDNGMHGLELVLQHRPDLALIGTERPVLDGLEVSCRILQQQPLCIVLLTDQPDSAEKERARQAGLRGYLVKPLNGQALMSALEQAYTDFQKAMP